MSLSDQKDTMRAHLRNTALEAVRSTIREEEVLLAVFGLLPQTRFDAIKTRLQTILSRRAKIDAYIDSLASEEEITNTKFEDIT